MSCCVDIARARESRVPAVDVKKAAAEAADWADTMPPRLPKPTSDAAERKTTADEGEVIEAALILDGLARVLSDRSQRADDSHAYKSGEISAAALSLLKALPAGALQQTRDVSGDEWYRDLADTLYSGDVGAPCRTC